jgi:hypothetical protein
MSVSCECCVLSGRGLRDGPVTRPEESYGVWCVCDLETSTTIRPRHIRAVKPFKYFTCFILNQADRYQKDKRALPGNL